VNEHEFEPVKGLPEYLPAGEHLLWQGAPSFRGLALRAFHVRKVAIYFGLLMAWRAGADLAAGQSAAMAAGSALGLLPLALLAVGLLLLLARLNAQATVYSITNRRVVMRFGVALPMALNLPFKAIDSAALRRHADGSGDLPLALAEGQRIGYFVNWPHVRPGRKGRSQPMLRSIPDADAVAALLAQALADHAGVPVQAAARDPQARQSKASEPQLAAIA
jgi:hypothetical protein